MSEYVIAAGVWHHAQRVFLLRIDYIQHLVLFPYRRQAADFIHAYRRDYIESYVEVLDVGALFVFLGVKNTPFTIAPFLAPFGIELATLLKLLEKIVIM